MSVSAVSSTATTYTSSTTSASSTSFSQEDFLSLLVEQLQNQNPLEPTSTDKVLDQMLSYANYGQQAQVNETLSAISTKLDNLTSALDITV
ncbi:MAG: flagellar hook capping FlgD N-terminal domain-containing protein [Candidatus Devosia phytovorans]|uniref:Basal-body rod modification protein FlgD n=1 Tax=Candidatus Devosia phytovorans TaxID=3121372 RepID=A0AAJ6AYU4_9HYPH|nr:flagellar hook capping FlgD N-terminal domain-containing protein [Devosia sp.]WEK03292.1 MAG: flagellar hook capping FlgD N-terminal domain-containing protein [Devosia sp.]